MRFLRKRENYCSTTPPVFFEHGFSLVEFLVAMAIVIGLASQILISFSALNVRTSLNRSAQELAFAIHRAQALALSVSALNIGDVSPVYQVPQSIGVFLSSLPGQQTTYFLFSDLNSDLIYSGPVEHINPNLILARNVRVQSLNGAPAKMVYILLTSPEATMRILSQTCGACPVVDLGNTLTIVLAAADGTTKTVQVVTSGQVTVK